MNCATRVGQSSPLGVTIAEGGANFSLFSRSATGVELLFFDNEGDDRPSRVIRIDPAANRTYHYWHLFVSGVESGLIYGYRVQGPSDLSRGMRFDRTEILLGVVKFFRLQNALKSASSKTASVDWIKPNGYLSCLQALVPLGTCCACRCPRVDDTLADQTAALFGTVPDESPPARAGARRRSAMTGRAPS
jgi:hypothetical protein